MAVHGQWPPLSLKALWYGDFLPPGDLQGFRDTWEMRKGKTLALAKALQCCCEWSSGPCRMMCGTARDLQSCMVDLMQFGEEDVLEIPLLESRYDMPTTSSNTQRRGCTPWWASSNWYTPVTYDEKYPEPEDVARLEETATRHQGVQVCLLPLLGFGPLSSELKSPLLRRMKY